MSLAVAVVLSIVAGGCLAALWQPFAGLLVYLWLDFMRPHDSFVALRAYRPMLIVAAVTIGATMWYRRRDLLADWKRFVPLLALVCVVGLSAIHGRDVHTSAGVVLEVVKMLILVRLISLLADGKTRFESALWVISLSVLVLGIGAIAQGWGRGLMHHFSVDMVVEGPPGYRDGLFRDNNDLARVLVLSVPLWWTLVKMSQSTGRKLVAAIALGTTIVAVQYTFSRAGFLALAVALTAVSLAYVRWSRAAVVVPLLLLGALLLVAPRSYQQRIATLERPAQESSVTGRLGIWQEAIKEGAEAPVLGVGPGTLRVGPGHRTSHNIFVEVFAETGLLGLACYLWVLVTAFVLLHRVRRHTSANELVRSASFGLEAALLAFLAASLTLSNAFQSPPFVLIGLTYALCRGDGKRWTASAP